MAEPALRLIDSSTGEEVPLQRLHSQALERVNLLEQDLANRERQERKLLRRIVELERDKDRERETCAERELIERIFSSWQEVCKKTRSKLTADRFDAIRARIRDGYEAQDFDLAIAGAAFDPFITRAKNGREICHCDIELVCRDGRHFESFANRAPRSRSAGD